MAWIYLCAAGLFEVGWPVGLKWAQEPSKTMLGIVVALVSMAISGWLLFLAQKEIPLGTAYAVWTGIGAVGTALLGIILFDEPATAARLASIGLIVSGIVGLKLVT